MPAADAAAECHPVPYSRAVRAAFVVAVLCFAASTASAEEIKEIRVEENKKTTADTVALICRIDIGDEWNNDMIETCRLRLISSGLFRDDPRVFSEPHKSG